jgi:hypothetical protein
VATARSDHVRRVLTISTEMGRAAMCRDQQNPCPAMFLLNAVRKHATLTILSPESRSSLRQAMGQGPQSSTPVVLP